MQYTGSTRLFLVISAQFTFKMCTTAKKNKKHYFGGSRWFKIINVDTTKKACH